MKLLEFVSGTYSFLILDPECASKLWDFVEDNSLPDPVSPEDYHCTVIYSKQPCPDVVNENFNLPCKGTPKGYKLLGEDELVLVLELECPNAEHLHKLFMEKYGATHDYDSYIPHVTLTKSYSGKMLPTDLPPFDIIFTKNTVEALED